jgi:hypothetical protein
VAAGALVDRADVEARAAADAVQGLATDAVAEDAGAAVVEQDQVDILAFENGLWNRISGQDMQSELSVLPQLAREKAAESDLPAEAESALQQLIEQRVHAPQPVHLIFKGATANETQMNKQ